MNNNLNKHLVEAVLGEVAIDPLMTFNVPLYFKRVGSLLEKS